MPTDAFGGLIPEQKAADALRNLFTFVAVRAIMAQEEGFDGSGQSKVYKDLVDAVQTPIQKSEEWIGNLMENGDNEMKLAAVKILAIREQYVTRQFDWKVRVHAPGQLSLHKPTHSRAVPCQDRSLFMSPLIVTVLPHQHTK